MARAAAKTVTRRITPIVTGVPFFNWTVLAVVIAGLISFVGAMSLAFWGKDPPTEAQRTFAYMCDMGWKMTLGAIVGLLGGRAGKPDRIEISDH